MTWAAEVKSRILAEYHRNLPITLVQRWVRTRMNKESRARNMILRCERNFQNRVSTAHSARSGRPRSPEQRNTQVQYLFQ